MYLFQYRCQNWRTLLQEVQFSSGVFKRDIEPWFLQMDYGGVAKQRTNGRDDGCAIFYRNTKFR